MAKPDLAGLLAQAAESRNLVRCKTCRMMDEATPDDAAVLSQALSDPDIASAVIARAMTNYGVTVSPSAVARHRRECR